MRLQTIRLAGEGQAKLSQRSANLPGNRDGNPGFDKGPTDGKIIEKFI
jgi:hypothetical protein